MIGPGKYDDLCTLVRVCAQATGIVLCVLDGVKGSGFTVQAPDEYMVTLPEMLRKLADSIEADIKAARIRQGQLQ